ncbi:MAG: T9SS type A sorting domain-containing protein, partial [Calditrichaeota bacterium]|nr:T9SS type A sorting domain-containing protein [Calditrichota bacterium]
GDLPLQGSFFRPRVQITSRFNSGDRYFEREVLFRVSLTGIDDGGEGLPTAFALEGNYPNPFNPSTTIRYALPEAARVTITLYNAAGQRVRTLVEGRQSAGFRQVVWDGRDERGESVSSGVYLYRMTARNGTETGPGFTATAKMVLLK